MRKDEQDVMYVEKTISIHRVANRISRFFQNCQIDLIDLAKKLCDNEIEISKALEPCEYISLIRESHYDKVEQQYHMYSLYAELGTLLSQEHKVYL